MQAYDAEKNRIMIEDAQRAARNTAVDTAVQIKAQAIADERKVAAVKAVQDIKAAQLKMENAEKGVSVADAAVRKGWLPPKLAAEMALTQKGALRKAERKLKQSRKKELRIKVKA